MELQFENQTCHCLSLGLQEIQEQEQTQEVKLQDSQPDLGRILAVRGQCLLRSKEWRSGGIGISGGVTAWVLYVPEGDNQPVCVETWIPFQMKWPGPEEERDGTIRVRCRLVKADARVVSARRMMVRAVVSVQVEAFQPQEMCLYAPPAETGEVQLLERTYPVRIRREAGEKMFTLEEDLSLPAGCDRPEKLISCMLEPVLQDRKIVGDRMVFRGAGMLHCLLMQENGRLCACDLEIPFSQLAELDRDYGDNARGDVVLEVTAMETEWNGEGYLSIKCGLVAQYCVSDQEMLRLAEDAYGLNCTVDIHAEELRLPVVLDENAMDVTADVTVNRVCGDIVDAVFLPEHPALEHVSSGICWGGSVEVLYYDENGEPQSEMETVNWVQPMLADENTRVWAGLESRRPQVHPGSGSASVNIGGGLRAVTGGWSTFPMIAGLKMGDIRQPDPGRPSLILRRPDEQGLWALAKRCGSTVDAILAANHLQGEPTGEPILLIPVL